MKKILIILLIVCFVASSGIVALAKVSFGSWDKWDELLPPWDNKGWQEKTYSTFISFPLLEGSLIWLWVNEDWEIIKVGHSPSAGTEDVFFLLTRLSFMENKKLQASIILFSSAQISPAQIDKAIKNISIEDALDVAEIAIVAFPPKKGEVVVRAYERKSGSFLFLEEWTAQFKNNSVIFPEKTTEFTQKYESWINNQFQQQGIEEGKYHLSPRLVVNDKKKEFFIAVTLKVFDGEKIKTPFFF